jgi:hypothetical protein
MCNYRQQFGVDGYTISHVTEGKRLQPDITATVGIFGGDLPKWELQSENSGEGAAHEVAMLIFDESAPGPHLDLLSGTRQVVLCPFDD